MENLLQRLETHFQSVPEAEDELLPPATPEELDAAEQKLGVKFPEEFRQLYSWHNGNTGDLFLFGAYRIFPIQEILEYMASAEKNTNKDWYEVNDSSGVFKDCIANKKWIQFGDNGGNTILFLDMDPGEQGKPGQILESCDGDPECNFSGVSEFLQDIDNSISSGQIVWDEDAGSYWEAE